MSKISRCDLFRLYLRSFFVQTGWSYERMIAFGFTWILIPIAKKLCSSIEEQRDFLKRHLLSFNANPYLASYALGAVAKLEEEKTAGEQIQRFKDSLRGPLGALGDSLIWQNLRPALLILGITLSQITGVFGALCFFLIFNFHQIYLRARGVIKGYALGFDVISDLSKGHIQNAIKWSSRLGAVLLGILFVIELNRLRVASMNLEKIILFLLFILLSFFGFKKSINPNYILLISVVLFLAIKAVIILI
jgi:mannose/fructose/N-acetylgalactosamine-specific phosphotransferase system component IID